MRTEVSRPQPALVSVVVPCFNAGELLHAQLEALSVQTYRGAWELLVVDNRSTDGSAERARSWQERIPRLRVVLAPERAGVSYARNVGVREAAGEFVVICDADDVAEREWLDEMVRAGLSSDIVGGANRKFLDTIRRGAVRNPDWSDPFKFLEFAPGGNFGAWKEVIESVGGWREDYIAGCDDIEFSWRAQLLGYRLGLNERALMNYRVRSELSAAYHQKRKYEIMNVRLFLDYRLRGVKRRSALELWRLLWFLLLRIPYVFLGPVRRNLLAETAGRIVGRIEGAIRFRAPLP